MTSQEAIVRQEVAVHVTKEQIERLKKVNLDAGATSCELVEEDGKRFLITVWPPIE